VGRNGRFDALKLRFFALCECEKTTRKKLFATIIISFLCSAAFAQGSIPQYGVVMAGSTQSNIAHTYGQLFNSHSPEPATLVAEGIEQAYAIDAKDTMLLYSDEIAPYIPGQNEVYISSVEGYDSIIQRQVYALTCPPEYDTVMAVSGKRWCTVELVDPYLPVVEPVGSPVTVTSSPENPHDYPVGETTVVTWTASVAGQTKECHQNVKVDYFPCATQIVSVTDVDMITYPVVNLGYYCWTAENLRTLHNSDMTDIPDVMTYPSQYAPGITDMAETFGHLYTWNAAVNNTAQGICPPNWHIPTIEETAYVVSAFDASQLMSNDPNIHWIPSDGTDDFGFRFLPAGYYNSSLERYEGLFTRAYFWTTESVNSDIATAVQFGSACETSELSPERKDMGFSVRCVLNY